jgi:hypothetical protein
MSSEPPPNPITDSFNLRAWIQNTVLSLATANTLYLSKRIADTAQGIITFLTGIKTDSINPTTTTGTLQIGHDAVNSNIEIACQASRSTVLHLGDGDLSSGAVHINNGLGASGNVQVLNANYTGTQVKGSFNLMTGNCSALSTGGTVNIQNGTSNGVCRIGNPNSRFDVDCSLNLLTSNGASSNVNILSGNYVNGDTAGNINILSGTSAGTVANGNFNLMTGSCDGTATIGNSVSTLALSAGTINLNKPLTAGYAYATESGSVGAGSTGVGKIGQIIRSPYSALTAPSGVKSIMGEVILTAGVWILTGNFNLSIPPNSATFAQTAWYLGSIQYAITDYAPFTGSTRAFSGTTVIYSSGGGTYQLKIEIYYSGGVQATAQNTSWNISALRIG